MTHLQATLLVAATALLCACGQPSTSSEAPTAPRETPSLGTPSEPTDEVESVVDDAIDGAKAIANEAYDTAKDEAEQAAEDLKAEAENLLEEEGLEAAVDSVRGALEDEEENPLKKLTRD